MSIPIFQVDSFTAKPFRGNPAGVCLLDRPAKAGWMQAVAAEMNLSETAFLLPEKGGFRLRWFTPKVEVNLCGHATLATAHVLWEEHILPLGAEARFSTRSGLLTASRTRGWVELDFPARPVGPNPPAWEKEAALCLGLRKKPVFVGTSREDAIIEVGDERTVRSLRPDLSRLTLLPVRAVAVTSRASTRGFDFVSRFFAPAVGIDEDPVTGSAHCALTPYWADKLGRPELRALQASERGGELRVRLDGRRVKIAGQAVTVFRGALRV